MLRRKRFSSNNKHLTYYGEKSTALELENFCRTELDSFQLFGLNLTSNITTFALETTTRSCVAVFTCDVTVYVMNEFLAVK